MSFDKKSIYTFVDKYFVYLAVIIVVIVLTAGLKYFLLPVWKEVRGTDALKVELLKKDLEEAKQSLKDLKAMRQAYASVDYKDIQRLQKLLPRSLDLPKLYAQVESFAARSGFIVSNLSIQPAKTVQAADATKQRADSSSADATTSSTAQVGKVETVSISISLQGINTYSSFKQFIQSVSDEAPLMDITSLTFPTSSTGSIQMQTYYLSEL